jgi:hypothetical protein
MQAAAHGIGLHANSDQIVAFKTVQSIFPTDSHLSILRVFARKNFVEWNGRFFRGFCDFHRVSGW